MAKNGKEKNHTRHMARGVYFLRNGEKNKMYKIDWFEGGMKLKDIGNKNVGEHDLTPRTKHIMVRLYT